jgi:hypothetical protein
MEKYYRCWKCGNTITKGEKNKDSICTASASWRISGICGGSLSDEISETVYNSIIENWEKLKEEKKE